MRKSGLHKVPVRNAQYGGQRPGQSHAPPSRFCRRLRVLANSAALVERFKRTLEDCWRVAVFTAVLLRHGFSGYGPLE